MYFLQNGILTVAVILLCFKFANSFFSPFFNVFSPSCVFVLLAETSSLGFEFFLEFLSFVPGKFED